MHPATPVLATDPEGQVDNLGPVGAALHGVLAVVVLLGTLLGVRILDADWAPSLLIFGLLATAYLALTGVTRLDFFLAALASTGGPPGARRERRRRMRRMRGRPT